MEEEWKVYAEVVASQAKRWPDKCGHHRNLWCVSNLGNFKIMYNYKEQEKIQVPSRSGGWKGMYLHIATPAGGYREHDILVIGKDNAENITKFPFGPEHNIIKS